MLIIFGWHMADRTQSTSTGASQSDYSQARSQLQGMGYAIDELPDG